ncbi:MAG: heme oxygenase (biliverdin-producing) [Pseudanabaenaceae cyanobacterium]
MNTGLAELLREGTKKSHSAAENTNFVKFFLKGVVSQASYRKLVANLYFVYSTLEAELTRHQDHPVLRRIYYPQLWRKASLQADLAYYFGQDWEQRIAPSPACMQYLQRIKQVSEQQPELLVAHAYTRYLGDLSGGQILKKIAQKAMGLQDGQGTAFYEFTDIRNHGAFKKEYRQALDGLPVSAEMAEAIVDEANHAFHLNMEMFKELEGNWLLSLCRLTWNSLFQKQKGRKPVPKSMPETETEVTV